jgi:hypothetical protein
MKKKYSEAKDFNLYKELKKWVSSYYKKLLKEFKLTDDSRLKLCISQTSAYAATHGEFPDTDFYACVHFNTGDKEVADDTQLEINEIKVMVFIDWLSITLLENINNIRAFRKYIQIYLRHEIGHVLEMRALEAQGITAGEYRKNKASMKAAKQEYEQLSLSGFEMYHAYYNLPSEKKANELAGLTIEALWKAECGLNR